MQENEKYRGRRFSVLGDSISTLEGYSEPRDAAFYCGMTKYEAGVYTPEDTWWGQVISGIGGEILSNNSFSGSTVCRTRGCMIPSYGASDERTSALGIGDICPDVIIVYMGTNDWGCNLRPLPASDADADDMAVFSVAYRCMIEKLKTNYPNAEIWCVTLAVSMCSRCEDFVFPYRYSGRHIEEYCDVIRECAAGLGCRLIDLYAHAEPYDTIDGFHPNADGMRSIARAVLGELGYMVE